MRYSALIFFSLTLLTAAFGPEGALAEEEESTVGIRGNMFNVFFIPGGGKGPSPRPAVLYLPGDGGWRGFAITMARTIASWGYDTWCIDTHKYLEVFTGDKTALTPQNIMGDFHTLGEWIRRKSPSPITLVGWSEGAGLGLAAAASNDNKDIFNGLVTLGLGATNTLGWRTSDDITWVTGKEPKEPEFASKDYMARVSPLPFLMIQSSGDKAAPSNDAVKLFALARDPKRFELVNARNHRFDGNTDGFFRTLREGLEWIQNPPR